MSSADRERWDRKHAGSGVVQPTAPEALAGSESLLPAGGRALDVACGRGAASVWLAQRGLFVEAVDVSPMALRSGVALASEYGVSERVRWWAHDLDAGLPRGAGSGFAVVVCQRFRDPRLYPALAQALAPNGLLAISILSRTDSTAGRFRGEPGELLAAFASLHKVDYREAAGEAHLLALRS